MITALHHSTTSTDLIETMRLEIHLLHSTIDKLNAQIAHERWNPTLKMFRASGLHAAIEALPDTTTYTVVICDINGMHGINDASGSWDQTDVYLAGGLAVRHGEIAGQLHQKGDEFCFVIADRAAPDRRMTRRSTNRRGERQHTFVTRISRQLASQPIPITATFATRSGVRACDVLGTVAALSREVLTLKARRV